MQVIRPKQLCKKLGFSRSTLWRLQKTSDFPKAYKVSERAVGWNSDEIEVWFAKRR